MTAVRFTELAWAEYVSWQAEDKKTLRRINILIQDIQRNGLMEGIGKPEKLIGSDEYSRRIDNTNRLVYAPMEDGNFEIRSCKGHYE
jgi:toxin YoeB